MNRVIELARLTLASAIDWVNTISVSETKTLEPSMRISAKIALPCVMYWAGMVEKASTAIGV